MTASHGLLKCKLYPSAFSGEAVFQVDTHAGQRYEGVVPKHCILPSIQLLKKGVNVQIKVHVLENDGFDVVRVRVPDGQVLAVPFDKVHDMRR